MGKLFKQLGKAACYTILFGGMQVIITFIGVTLIGIKLAMDTAAAGYGQSEAELADNIMILTMENTGWIQVVSGVMTLAFAWLIFAVRKKKLLKEANVVPFPKNRILPIVLLGICTVLVVEGAFSLLPIPESTMLEYEESVMSLLAGSTLSIMLSTVIGAPIVEEVIFRGLVFSRLSKAMPIAAATILSSIIFGLFHGQIIWVCYTTCLGLLMCFVAVNCKSVLASILFHMVFNFFGGTPLLGYLLGENETLMVIVQIAALAVSIAMVYWMLKLSSLDRLKGE